MSMSPASIANILNAADNLSSLRFHVSQFENKRPELRCIIHALPGLSKEDHEKLAAALNAVVFPVVQQHCATLLKKAANQLREHL